MSIGLDLGTGITKVAWQAALRPEDDEFRVKSVPTAVLFRGLEGSIPAFSPVGAPQAAETRCDGFPLLLGSAPYARVAEWGNRTPAEVAQAFLRLQLSRGGRGDGDLVVTAPAAPGQLGEILAAIGEPPRRMISAPVATVTYLRHARPHLSAAARFIVCDLGAGSTSIALCAAGPRATVVTDSTELVGAAAWSDDTAPPAQDGRPDTLTERLAAALAMTQGATTVGMSTARWRGLEAALRQRGGDWPRALTDSGRGPWSGDRTPVLRFADLAITAAEFLRACAPLAERAGWALRTLLARQPERDWRDAATRIVLLGGLSALWPVRESLLVAAGLDPVAPGPALVDLDAATRLEAPARGAALVAAGKAGSSRYPHLLRLPVHREMRGELAVEHIELAAAGTIDYEEPERMLRDTAGQPYVVQVRQGQEPPLVEIVTSATGTPVPAVFTPATPPVPGRYRIAIGGGADGVTLVLHRADGPGSHRYVLNGSADPPETAGPSGRAEGETEL